MLHGLSSIRRTASRAAALVCCLSFATGSFADEGLTDVWVRIATASAQTKTLSADLIYTVTSARQQQFTRGSVKLMKPNYARVTFDYLAQPAFPSLVASDGKHLHTFTPSSFREDRRFNPTPDFDPLLGAKQASGLAAGGGRYTKQASPTDGSGVVLWDAAPIQSFFTPRGAVWQLYARGYDDFTLEPPVEIDGVKYDVLHHHFERGNIAGGENSEFDQRLYVAPDGVIHQYVLEFESAGARGTQVTRLKNVVTNTPMEEADFEFTPPAASTQVRGEFRQTSPQRATTQSADRAPPATGA